MLVLLGVRLDGTKELIALAEGLRESTESWADLLRDCRRRGMRDPELMVGDGAMGLWKALTEVFPAARHQRCWVHKARNVSNALPKSAQPGATKAMQEIYNAEDRAHAQKAVEAFAKTYGAKWPKAVAKIIDDQEELLAFYDFPAEHWIHLRTTNPIKSTFSTVKLRTKATRGAGSPAAALAMVFKLVESAQDRWRAITGAHLVSLVRRRGQVRERRPGRTRRHARGVILQFLSNATSCQEQWRTRCTSTRLPPTRSYSGTSRCGTRATPPPPRKYSAPTGPTTHIQRSMAPPTFNERSRRPTPPGQDSVSTSTRSSAPMTCCPWSAVSATKVTQAR